MPELKIERSIARGWHLTCGGEPVTLPSSAEGQLLIERVEGDCDLQASWSQVEREPTRLRLTADVIFDLTAQKER